MKNCENVIKWKENKKDFKYVIEIKKYVEIHFKIKKNTKSIKQF